MGNRNKRNSGSIFILLVVFLSVAFAAATFTSPALGQVLYGSITGTVTDATGAAVPNVNVTATDQGTGAARMVQSGSAGEYQIGNLLPGTYTVSIAATGNFGGFTQKNVALNVNQVVRVDVTLQAATVSAEVTVTAAPPMLQTDTAEVTHQISEAQISQLPITSSQGRNFQALYQLVPGVYSMGEQNSTSANPSRAMAINVNGVSNMGTTTRIDGAVNTYGWLPYLIAYVPPADSIQNVSIST
ncbi:MAG TPA: carboxypeptidase-like regulatory domain-containing protein, partial [Edaphobacter sp.]